MLTFGIRFEQKQLEAWAGIGFKRNCKEDKNNCDLKGKSDPECQNYIRVLSVIGKMHFLWRST